MDFPSVFGMAHGLVWIAQILAAATGLGLVWMIILAIYRLYFSELANFPGPKLAAATGWYEFYYDYFGKGRYIYEIEKMHAKYGPIVRVNPLELSLQDRDFYDEMYAVAGKRNTNGFPQFSKALDFGDSHFMTVSHNTHRQRRKPFEPYFSRAGILKLQPMLNALAGKIDQRLHELQGTGRVVRFDHMFAAFAGDCMMGICCEDQDNLLDHPEWSPDWFFMFYNIIIAIPFFVGFPWLVPIIASLPRSVLLYVDPRIQNLFNFKIWATTKIRAAKEEAEAIKRGDMVEDSRPTLFRDIVLHGNLPESELSIERLTKEAQVILGAGSVTIGRTLDFTTVHILSKPKVRTKLTEELRPLMADYPARVPSSLELEKLPYLQALIKEGLRCSYGAMHRLPRTFPDGLQYKQWLVPPGVPIGMSSYLMHVDPVVFPDPLEFKPERWLGNYNPQMDKSLTSYSRGSRVCLGMFLAQAQFNIMLAMLFRPEQVKYDLFETDESDVAKVHDFFIGVPRMDSKGVRVIVH